MSQMRALSNYYRGILHYYRLFKCCINIILNFLITSIVFLDLLLDYKD